MSAADRRKWDARYRAGAYESRPHPSAFLESCLPLLPRQGRALDLACGTGRNALFLAGLGLTVDAVDISSIALAKGRSQAAGLAIDWRERDLDDGIDCSTRYDLIVNIRYVNLPLLERLVVNLNPNGLLLVEQHLRTDRPVVGPQNPAFRVRPGELKQVAKMLNVVRFEEGLFEDPDGNTAALARLLARRTRRR